MKKQLETERSAPASENLKTFGCGAPELGKKSSRTDGLNTAVQAADHREEADRGQRPQQRDWRRAGEERDRKIAREACVIARFLFWGREKEEIHFVCAHTAIDGLDILSAQQVVLICSGDRAGLTWERGFRRAILLSGCRNEGELSEYFCGTGGPGVWTGRQ